MVEEQQDCLDCLVHWDLVHPLRQIIAPTDLPHPLSLWNSFVYNCAPHDPAKTTFTLPLKLSSMVVPPTERKESDGDDLGCPVEAVDRKKSIDVFVPSVLAPIALTIIKRNSGAVLGIRAPAIIK